MPEVKVRILWDQFFLLKPEADLGDIKGYSYLPKAETMPQINEIDIWCKLYKL